MTKSKRIKATPITDNDTFFQIVNQIADMQASMNVTLAERDRDIQTIQAKYATKLSTAQLLIAAKMTLAAEYAEEHKDALLPKDKKSVDLAQATFGFRMGNRTVRLLSKLDEATVIENLRNECLDDYIRIVESIAKDAILADCEDDKTLILPAVANEAGEIICPEEPVSLSKVGLKITQAETFYVEPKVATGATLKPTEA